MATHVHICISYLADTKLVSESLSEFDVFYEVQSNSVITS
jgi:hypothetical protein